MVDIGEQQPGLLAGRYRPDVLERDLDRVGAEGTEVGTVGTMTTDATAVAAPAEVAEMRKQVYAFLRSPAAFARTLSEVW